MGMPIALALLLKQFMTPPYASWALVQSAGGIQIGEPKKAGDLELLLPVQCDLSKADPTLVVREVHYRVRKKKILIGLITEKGSNTPGSHESGHCYDLKLVGIPPGQYELYYDEKPNGVRMGDLLVGPH